MSRELLPGVTGVLVLADGTVLQGIGVGATGEAVGEVCFNTAMTGYQEILTDPSYMAQIVAFTFPHIGNVGTNLEDVEQIVFGHAGCTRQQRQIEVPPDDRGQGQRLLGDLPESRHPASDYLPHTVR